MKIELDKNDYDKLQAKLLKLGAVDKTALSTEIGKAALNIARDMKKIAPVDSGNLRRNIKAVVNNKQAEIRSDAPYSGYVEFGGKNPKRPGAEIPFFYPSVNKGIKNMISSIDNTIKNLLK
jgi:HK97 gp10 family phage protein